MEPSHNSQLFELPASQPSSCFLTSRSDACLCLCLLCSVDLKGFWNSSHGNDHVHPLRWSCVDTSNARFELIRRTFSILLRESTALLHLGLQRCRGCSNLRGRNARHNLRQEALLEGEGVSCFSRVYDSLPRAHSRSRIVLIIFLPVYLVTSKDGLAAKISILL